MSNKAPLILIGLSAGSIAAVYWFTKTDSGKMALQTLSTEFTIIDDAAFANILNIGEKKNIDILARTLWGEARGESYQGIQGVANVIVNRYNEAKKSQGKYKLWGGASIAKVCQAPYQFSCWNANDPNRAKMLALTVADPIFAQCVAIATLAVQGKLPDVTGGSTYYHTSAVKPAWSKGLAPVATIGNHKFFTSTQVG